MWGISSYIIPFPHLTSAQQPTFFMWSNFEYIHDRTRFQHFIPDITTCCLSFMQTAITYW